MWIFMAFAEVVRKEKGGDFFTTPVLKVINM